MAFQPIIPMSGIGGWKYLQATYDKQLQSHSNSPQVRRDRDYMIEKFSQPIAVEDFLKDARLVRVSMTAFDLSGEEWKKGFINKVLTEVADPESTFLKRLNNSKYTAFAEALKPQDGKITLSEDDLAAIAVRFEASSFELAVGNVDDNMRLALNYQDEIKSLAAEGVSDTAIAYRILGDVPVSTLLKTALNLPSDMKGLSIERQAEILQNSLKKTLGVSKLSDMASPEIVDKAIVRYHAMKSITEGSTMYTPASAALTLLGGSSYGYGNNASQNLFLSIFL